MKNNCINNYIPALVIALAITFALLASQNLYSDTQFDTSSPLALLKRSITPLNNPDDYNTLINRAAQVPFVLIGDSTHGTHEFYQQRINISKRLIQEQGFKLILMEGDWPNIYTLNQYVQSSTSLTAEQALNAFNPEAAWLWNNKETLDFVKWLKRFNEQLPEGEQKVSLHGMDIYTFSRSKKLVVDYLYGFSPQAAQQALSRYQCFERFNNDLHRYGQAVSKNQSFSCEQEVVEQYQDFAQCRFPCPEQYPFIDREAFFDAKQNARVVKNVEKSLRINYMTNGQSVLWNQRDQHMMESLLASSEHLHNPKTIVWAHVSHLGDARATDVVKHDQLNLGQLLRQRFGDQVFSIGMLTYSGQVMASDDWNLPAKLKVLRAAHPDTNAALFHQLGVPRFILNLQQSPELVQLLKKPRLQRHVGVVYRPQDEMKSHYSYTLLADQFDAVVYTDVSTEITPLK